MEKGEKRRIHRAAEARVNVSVRPIKTLDESDNYEWLLSKLDILNDTYTKDDLMLDLDNDLVQLARLVSICARIIGSGNTEEYILVARKILLLASREG